MSKVYIVNKSGHDFSQAEVYGELIILTQGTVNVFATDRLRDELRNKLKDSQEGDYLLLSGSGVLCALATLIMIELHGKVKWLLYNFKSHEYVVREVVKREVK